MGTNVRSSGRRNKEAEIVGPAAKQTGRIRASLAIPYSIPVKRVGNRLGKFLVELFSWEA